MTDRSADLLTDVATSPRLARALLGQLERLLAAGDSGSAEQGAALFESFWHLLPPFDDERMFELAAALYERCGQPDGVRLFRARPGGKPDAAVPGAAAVLATPQSAAALLHELERLDTSQEFAAAAALFEAVWRHVVPAVEYWIYHRMSQIYAALGRPLAATLIAGIAVQIEPGNIVAGGPYRQLLAWFRARGRLRDAALLCQRRAALCPEAPLLSGGELDALLAEAGALPALPPPAGRHDRLLLAAEIRPPSPWRSYGGVPPCLRELEQPLRRSEIRLAELTNAEVLLDRGAVAVFGADGVAHGDLSIRESPGIVRRSLDRARRAGQPVEELALDLAVVVTDEFPPPNLCHFMMDQASRFLLYRQAGVDVAAASVIGPQWREEYQRVVGGRVGMRAYVSCMRRARVRVDRLLVSSNCRRLQHPAHWGSRWAVQSVREQFDLAPRAPGRRLLISRDDAPSRRIANQAEVQAVLAPYGFETIVPGRMAFAEQWATFRDATHVVAPHGAALGNILFCAPGTHVLEVFGPLYGTWAYAMIAPALGLDYASMLGRDGESDEPKYNDPSLPQARRNEHIARHMRVDLDQLRHWLRDCGLCD